MSIIYIAPETTLLEEEKCIEGVEQYQFKMKQQKYNGYWSKPVGLRKKMEIQGQKGRAIRCIDCVKRKGCSRLRSNKYARKPCKYYVADLAKQSRLINQKIKEKEDKRIREKNQSS
ncbi:MAG: hypothetical protein ACTSW7_01395 [Candidatus Thorarchaeota archaeon]|nr:hypothetical protein [Thermoplasmatales archaeon]